MGKGEEASSGYPAAPLSCQSQGSADMPPTSKWTPTAGKLVEEADGKVAFMDNHLVGLVYDEVSHCSRYRASYCCMN